MIELKNVYKSFGDQVVFQDFSYSFQKDKNYLLIGESGIGKTTLLKIIVGIIEPDKGEIIRDFHKASMVFQEDRLCEGFNAIENVAIVNEEKSQAEVISLLEELLDKDLLQKPVKDLSGGQKRRVVLARALLSNSGILLLDEPFTGMDQQTKEKAIACLKKHQNHRLTIITGFNQDGLEDYEVIRL